MRVAKIAMPWEGDGGSHRDACIAAVAVGLSPNRAEVACQQVEHWRTHMLLDWIAACAPPARVLARGVAFTETRVDQPAPGNDVNVLIDVVYDEMLKSSATANPPLERNSRYERLGRAEHRERQKQKRAIAGDIGNHYCPAND